MSGKLIKICGLKTRNQVISCVREGVDFMGIVFAEKSHRYMGNNLKEVSSMVEVARTKANNTSKCEIFKTLPAVVGVFQRKGEMAIVDDASNICNVMKETNMHGVQLYGYNTEEFNVVQKSLAEAASDAFIIFTISIEGKVSAEEFASSLPKENGSSLRGICIDHKDSKNSDLLGGSGKPFDWSTIPNLDSIVNRNLMVFLAGGITDSNVESAISIPNISCIDLSSSVEVNKIKNGDRIRKMTRAVKKRIPAYFGKFGGQFLPEILMPNLIELEKKYIELQADEAFLATVDKWNKEYSGRPTFLYDAERLTAFIRNELDKDGKSNLGAKIWLKREDLLHGGAHKINNGIGQALVAKELGKKRIIAETGAGQHGVATATVCALFGMDGTVYMGEKDTQRQRLNVLRMESMGTKVVPATSGGRTLNAAVNEALRDWAANSDSHYLIGSVVGPHPFPTLVRDFQSVISREAREQFMAGHDGALPNAVVACVGGGSNCIGAFDAFVCDDGVDLIGVEAGGDAKELHSATLTHGTTGWLHGARTKLLQTEEGQVSDTHSISAGLDYPAVGPEHSFLQDTGRARYIACSDDDALNGFKLLTRTEGVCYLLLVYGFMFLYSN